MAEPDKRQIGDGSDNYGEAAKQMAKAAKEAGIETAKQAAVKGAEAGANAAAATVQAGVEGGKAVAEIAAGTAAGGPWGAILSAAWAMRHTLSAAPQKREGLRLLCSGHPVPGAQELLSGQSAGSIPRKHHDIPSCI